MSEMNYAFCNHCEYNRNCLDKPLDDRNEHCDNATMIYYIMIDKKDDEECY